MKIVLTGANGNLAQNFAQQAVGSGLEIVPVVRDSWDQIDQLMPGADAVLHAAGDIRTSPKSHPYNYLDSNLITTAQLLELCVKHSVPRFYFVSSCAVYGDINSASESQVCHPVSINGKLKKINEDIVEEFCLANDIRFSCFRVFNLFGGNDRFSIVYYLARAAKNQTSFSLNNNGLSQRDFIHVSDVAEIILKMIKANVFPTHVNVGTGYPTKIADLLDVVKSRYPEIKTHFTFNQEIEYSRADTTLLNELIDKSDFISILEYVNEI